MNVMIDMITNLKCKNCGYEISLVKSWDRIEFYHTGVEKNMIPNRYCHMVRKHSKINKNKVAKLNNEDIAIIVRELMGTTKIIEWLS